MKALRIRLPPSGDWAAAVSGGADSVAMLLLCRERVRCVVHVDHETREGASAEDAKFVVELAGRMGVPVFARTRAELERRLPAGAPRSLSARFRALRHVAFLEAVREFRLSGVLLAHHADDVAETVALRLLRGSAFPGLTGIARDTTLATAEGPVRLFRPLLACRRGELRARLLALGQGWREDQSNGSLEYGRNRVRGILAEDGALSEALMGLARAAEQYRDVLAAKAPVIESPEELTKLRPGPVARFAARRWLSRTVPAQAVSEGLVERFLAWQSESGGAPAFNLPGGLVLRRRPARVSDHLHS